MFYEEDGKTDRGRVGSFYFKDIRRTGCFFEDDGRTDRGKVVSRVLMVGEGVHVSRGVCCLASVKRRVCSLDRPYKFYEIIMSTERGHRPLAQSARKREGISAMHVPVECWLAES